MEGMDTLGPSLELGDCSLHPAIPWPRPPGSGFLRAGGPRWSALTATPFDANQPITAGSVLSETISSDHGGRKWHAKTAPFERAVLSLSILMSRGSTMN